MQIQKSHLLMLACAAALAGNAFAQNDDCTGAVVVVDGTNGPFTNVGSTTSTPAWPCAAGGNDIWFLYVATTTGTVNFTTCTATRTFDTAIEVFDGSAGCAALATLGCNDDFCALGSSLSVPVIAGVPYYVRVGGFSSATGSFDLAIGTPSTVTSYGTGCVSLPDVSFYENFATSAAFDLANSGMTLLRTGGGYLAVPAVTTFQAPSPTATSLALTDDSQVSVTLSAPFAVSRAQSVTSLSVCSNGFVSAGTANGTGFSPTIATHLTSPDAAWRCWHDFNPARAGSGAVKFEEVGGVAYVTWDGVLDFSTASTTPSTFQFQFELATGNVSIIWQSMSTGGNGWLVGYSDGGASNDPGNTDISAALPGTFSAATFGNLPLALAATAGSTPIAGSTMSVTTSNLSATTFFGAILLSFTQFDPGIPLGPGLATCEQYTGGDATLLYIPGGAASVNTTFTVPALVGFNLAAQSAAYDPASGLTIVGAVVSNGLLMGIGSI